MLAINMVTMLRIVLILIEVEDMLIKGNHMVFIIVNIEEAGVEGDRDQDQDQGPEIIIILIGKAGGMNWEETVEVGHLVETMVDIIVEKGGNQIHGEIETIQMEVKVGVWVEAKAEIKVGVEMVIRIGIEIDILIKILMEEVEVIVGMDILIKKIKIIIWMEPLMMDGEDMKKKKWKMSKNKKGLL